MTIISTCTLVTPPNLEGDEAVPLKYYEIRSCALSPSPWTAYSTHFSVLL